jgi:hypothetical protein
VTISLSNEMDLLLGLIFNLGPAPKQGSNLVPEIQSEFGTFPNALFLEWKWYF